MLGILYHKEHKFLYNEYSAKYFDKHGDEDRIKASKCINVKWNILTFIINVKKKKKLLCKRIYKSKRFAKICIKVIAS